MWLVRLDSWPRTRRLSPTKKGKALYNVMEKKLSGPFSNHISKYYLDENSHPMDWFTFIMPLTPNAIKEDIIEFYINSDSKTMFCIKNWSAYSNTKAVLVNEALLVMFLMASISTLS